MFRCAALLCFLMAAAAERSVHEHDRHARAIIVGGDDASVQNYPYQLSLRMNRRHACGAAIIGSRWALSAAHCCVDVEPATMSLRAGSSRSDVGGIIYRVQRAVPHPLFSFVHLDYDICAIQTVNPFQVSAVMKPIDLDPIVFAFPPDAHVIVTGWGRTVDRPGTGASAQLQSVMIPVVNNTECAARYASLGPALYVRHRQLCAGAALGDKDACQGDSGGPMAYKGRLVGIVSWGIGCGDKRYPGIYTSVAAMRGWIHDTTDI